MPKSSILLFCWTLIYITIFLIGNVKGNIHRAAVAPGSVSSSTLKSSKPGDEFSIVDENDGLGYLDILLARAKVSWLIALLASIIVGSTGIFPLFIFKVEGDRAIKEAMSPDHLKMLISFALGGLLGDAFLHLLPEAWLYVKDSSDRLEHIKIGLWIIAGLLSFMIIEKIFMEEERVRESMENEVDTKNPNITDEKPKMNGTTPMVKSQIEEAEIKCDSKIEYSRKEIKVIGYLNLLANCSDNFTHGLAIAGSFAVGIPGGLCTTVAILIHEIPHEIGDFAILLKAGFNRWDAAKAQIFTASGAIIGCLFGLIAESAGDSSSWILPYTSGGFIYIGMVTLVPDVVKEDDLSKSIKQIMFVLAGVLCMSFVSTLEH